MTTGVTEGLDLVAVIMAGGAGTRFWPLSTEKRPKQFLSLFGDKSLLRMSYERVSGLAPPERLLVLTNRNFLPLVMEQLPEVPPINVVGEPLRRDTAAAITLASLICRERFGDPLMLVLTADHLIEPLELFHKTALSALKAAKDDEVLYTFGIRPTYAATGYGYLELGKMVLEDGGIGHYEVMTFKEKPDRETAEEYLRSGRFLWNSGMFAWRTTVILEEIERCLPGHLQALEQAMKYYGREGWEGELEEAFSSIDPISIDYGVMERAERVRCVAASFRWSDVGGWLALKEYMEEDGEGNLYRGKLLTLDASGNLVFCEDEEEQVALIGVKGLVVVRAGGRTLIVPQERTEEVKRLLEEAGKKVLDKGGRLNQSKL